ncbi:uncharacterized protein LOC122195885 [Lactuca sativa]|uniref:uncharacterized protein LOC122195885 n=1 Tax=Lactuca sativa TaxID=4236 RepID=UPI0022AF26E9|nr:uncharacterized protein LOC122195885 [Lactuca sativa]
MANIAAAEEGDDCWHCYIDAVVASSAGKSEVRRVVRRCCHLKSSLLLPFDDNKVAACCVGDLCLRRHLPCSCCGRLRFAAAGDFVNCKDSRWWLPSQCATRSRICHLAAKVESVGLQQCRIESAGLQQCESDPDFGPMQGTRSQSVPDFGPMQLVSDFDPTQRARPWLVPDSGPMQLVPNFGPMQRARPWLVSGLRSDAVGKVLNFQKRSSGRLQCTHHLFSPGCLYSDIFYSC